MRTSTALSAILLLTVACGCSDSQIPTWPVSGMVVLEDGTPLETGTVEFASDDGLHTARGKIQNDGSFRLTTFDDGDGAVAGDHDAVVIQLVSTEDLPIHQHDHGPTIDPRFAHYDGAGLRFTVKPDQKNEFRIVVAEVDPQTAGP